MAHVTIQRFFFRTFASSKRRRNSRIKNTRLNEPRSSTRESGNLVWLLRVKHIWISSEPWSARLVNCQLCWNLKKCCGDEKFLVSLSLSSTRNRRQKSVSFFNIRRQCWFASLCDIYATPMVRDFPLIVLSLCLLQKQAKEIMFSDFCFLHFYRECNGLRSYDSLWRSPLL